jgi:tetratricopeptide (TPR) repeat protein
MLQTISRFPSSVASRESYVGMLLQRGGGRAYSDAGTQLDQLRKLAPNSPSVLALTVRWAIKTGKDQEVLALLRRQLPRVSRPQDLTPEQARMLALYAGLFTDLKDYETAERILRVLVERDPQQAYSLAQFLGYYKNVEDCLNQLETLYNPREGAERVLGVAINVLRRRRDEVGDKYDARVQDWLNRAMSQNYGSVPLLLTQAELFDVQQKYPEAIELYRSLLDNADVTGPRRAIVLNNLSYLLALSGTPSSAAALDPLKLVEEAVSILGPTSDILDTRAVVLIARQHYSQAIADLELAVTDNPTATKYFHKATAHLLAGENKAALEAWGKAEELGLATIELSPLEKTRFQEIKTKIDELRSGTAVLPQAPLSVR